MSSSFRCDDCQAGVCRSCAHIEKAGFFAAKYACSTCYDEHTRKLHEADVDAVMAKALRRPSTTGTSPANDTAAQLIFCAERGYLTSHESRSADADWLVHASENPTMRHLLSPPEQRAAGWLIAAASKRGARRA